MLLLNLWGGPGSGKTTLAHYLTYRFKRAGIRAEFVGEAARERIYTGTGIPPQLLDNQVIVTAEQFERIVRLQRHSVQVAVSDSPLLQGLIYCTDHFYYDALKALVYKLNFYCESRDIFVQRNPGVYDPESRVQRTESEAVALDQDIRALVPTFWEEIGWGEEHGLALKLVQELRKR